MAITARATRALTRPATWMIPAHRLLTERIAYGDCPDEGGGNGLEMRAIVVAGLMAIPLWALLAVGISLLVGMV